MLPWPQLLRLPVQPAVHVGKLEKERRKRCTFRVFIGLSGRLVKKKKGGRAQDDQAEPAAGTRISR